jgi:hypothetical protein
VLGRQRARPHLNLTSRRSIEGTEDAFGLWSQNEKENVASLGVADRRLRLRRMRNARRHSRGYTEPWERLETNSIRLG